MQVQYLSRSDKPRLAYVYTQSTGQGKKYPLVMFCGGFRSDMGGTKALYLEEKCRERGQAYLRFDYSGHGLSEGLFEDGTIGAWTQDAIDVLNHVSPSGPAVIAGSSMGGWIALLVARQWKGMLQGIAGIAAAPDFTEEIYSRLSDSQKHDLAAKGAIAVVGDEGAEPFAFSRRFYEEAGNHLVLGTHRNIDFPMRLIHGMQDKEVPWETALKIEKNFTGGEVNVVFVQDGGHRLSRPEDLDLIDREIRSLCGMIE